MIFANLFENVAHFGFGLGGPGMGGPIRPDESGRDEVLADLARVREERDASAVEARLAALERDARGSANLMPSILAAVEAYATLGEICSVLEGVFGKYRPPEVL